MEKWYGENQHILIFLIAINLACITIDQLSQNFEIFSFNEGEHSEMGRMASCLIWSSVMSFKVVLIPLSGKVVPPYSSPAYMNKFNSSVPLFLLSQ